MHLFAYGTLMMPFVNPAASHLRLHARLLGTATIPGRLFDVGGYPGLVCVDGLLENRVIGQVFELAAPELILPLLDEYEGFDQKCPGAGEYRRERREVRFGDRLLPCWMYLYNRVPENLVEIPGGDYRAYLLHKPPG